MAIVERQFSDSMGNTMRRTVEVCISMEHACEEFDWDSLRFVGKKAFQISESGWMTQTILYYLIVCTKFGYLSFEPQNLIMCRTSFVIKVLLIDHGHEIDIKTYERMTSNSSYSLFRLKVVFVSRVSEVY
jgi:hypothetical protein